MQSILIATFLLFLVSINLQSQDVPYGLNEKKGKYANTGDANIYYEVYGEGRPVVLLHGGYHGYIDEFNKYIPVLSKTFKVIAIATRGYGKSEIGTKPFSYNLFAADVKTVLQQECQDSAILIGMSDGAMTSYVIASEYPEIVRKVVALGGPLGAAGYRPEGMEWLNNFRVEDFERDDPDFVNSRKKIMPQPERWNEFIDKLIPMWKNGMVLPENIKKIKCPVLLIVGDRDIFCKLEHIAEIYESIPNAQLAIIPNSGHGGISPRRNTFVFENYIVPFVFNNNTR